MACGVFARGVLTCAHMERGVDGREGGSWGGRVLAWAGVVGVCLLVRTIPILVTGVALTPPFFVVWGAGLAPAGRVLAWAGVVCVCGRVGW